MKLIRYGAAGEEKPGVEIEGIYYDVSAIGEDYNEHFFEHNGLERLRDYLQTNAGQLTKIPASSRLGAPFARPSRSHALA